MYMDPWHDARWIGTGRPSRRIGIRKAKHATGSRPAPMLRREFTVAGPVQSATLHICGLGYHDAWLNSRHVGDHVLDPAQTDYESRVFYAVHDVTGFVRGGQNCLGIMLGNGWYNQDRVWGKQGLSYGQPCLKCALHVASTTGTTQVITSDEAWKWAPGPVRENNIYAGEIYDARHEQPGWDAPGFDATGWKRARVVTGPAGKLEPQPLPPMRRIEEMVPKAISSTSDGACIVDFGQNFAGWVKVQLDSQVPAGTRITMRFAETVAADGRLDTGSTGVFATRVEQVDTYIAKGEGTETWEPRFTYHGFRYVEVTGWPGELHPRNIAGVVVHTDLPTAGSFTCSDERLNRLHQMALWTHRSNIHGIPEDCPARERCGWLGDANMVAEFSMWNFQARSFWEKYLDDIETTRARNRGIPANIAPGKRGTRGNANPDWAAAFIMLPWHVYVHHGDPAVLQQHWAGMNDLMAHYRRMAMNGWILQDGFGDWFDPGAPGIVKHTPPSLTSTLWFYRCARVMMDVARVLQCPGLAEKYAGWSERIKAAVIAAYYKPGPSGTGTFGSQTANAMALAFGLVPDGEASSIVTSLVDDIIQHQVHVTTGIMGIRYLFEVLSEQQHGDIALALMRQDTYPGFGDLIARGATTLWECWGEPEHDRVHGPRSLNHPMMGGFDNWFYTSLAGIRPDPARPGFQHFFLAPCAIDGLEWVTCWHDTPKGRIASEWRRTGTALEWTVQVPPGTTATITLPLSKQKQELGPGIHHLVDKPVESLVPCE